MVSGCGGAEIRNKFYRCLEEVRPLPTPAQILKSSRSAAVPTLQLLAILSLFVQIKSHKYKSGLATDI